MFQCSDANVIHCQKNSERTREEVKRVLEQIVRVSPSCGPTLLPMAVDLAHSLVRVETGAEDLHTGCKSAIEFLAKLSSIIAVEVPGAREDLKALHWKELPLIPERTELHETRMLKTDDLPVIKTAGNYKSEEDYLNTYFRLLREECFYKLRKGINDFVVNRSQFDSKDMMMYRIVWKAVSICHEHSPTVMSIALKYRALHSKGDAEGDGFLYGSLLCISMDNSFQEPVWATVEKHVADEEQAGQGIVWITLCGDGANVINEAQFIIKMQEISDRNEEAFMAEGQTFYLSFAPAMDVLQHRDCVPFKEFLVHPDTNANLMKPADYINEIKKQPDWEIIFKNDNLPARSNYEGESSNYPLLEEFKQIRLNSNYKAQLDETQLAALELALWNKLTLIQGPPGTGKSFVGVALVRLLLSMHVPQNHGPILVITYKNHALDHFLEECLKNVPSYNAKIVRVGRLAEGASEELEKCLLKEVGRRWPEPLYKQKRKLTGQLWAMQSPVREATRKLRESCIFNAETFLKEASNDQIKYLLVDNEHRTVDGAEVEALLDNQDHRSKTRLKELLENALKDWLPPQEKFDSFAREAKGSPKESGRAYFDTTDAAAKSKQSEKPKSKEVQEEENPNDFREPAMEQKERLLAVDEERPDEEDKEIMKDEATESQDCKVTAGETRKLVCIDETRVRLFRNLLNAGKVWELGPDERVQLAYVFQSSCREKACDEFLAVSQAYTQIHQQLKELRNQHDIEVMKKCHVIGMTVTGATMRANLLADIRPSVMIVEEAAEILEGQLVAVIPPSVQHLIMIGDHKQLRPMVHYQRLKRRHNFDLSMFERLFNCKIPYKQLGFQCRMRDEFVDLLRQLKIYPELKTNEQLVRENVFPQCVEKSMYFWTHTIGESDSKNSHSKLNEAEARKITEVAERLCGEGQVLPSKITVLCSYRGQVTEIKHRFLRSTVTALKQIAVATIDSFQGQENDIILISLVRSSQAGKIGYLSSLNRLCVAISRARCGLYLFGNHAHLGKASRKGWQIVSDAMREKKCLGRNFPFRSSDQFSEGRSSASELMTAPGNLTVINAKNVIVGGDNSVNTITSTPARNESHVMEKTENSPSATTPPQPFEMSFPRSDKTPVHNPKSPTSPAGFPSPRMEGGDMWSNVHGQATVRESLGADVQHVGERERGPTQVTPEAEKSFDLSEIENMKERPIQESEDPKSSIADTPAVEETPVQESEEQTGKKKELKDHPERGIRHVFQEGDLKGFNIKDEPLQETREPCDKEAKVEIEDQRDGRGQRPFQETQTPDKPQGAEAEEIKQVKHREEVHGAFSDGKPLQESASSNVETESWKEEALPTQETMAAGKGPFEETGKEQGPEAEETGQIKREGEEVLHEELTQGKPLQESASSNEETESWKEEALPTQETMAAGKGPFEETGKTQGTEAEETGQITEGEKVHEEITEGEPFQESASSNVESESCKEGLPTQETMAAGKGPFEETGDQVGLKRQPTDERE
ncbi:uncharacterized protein LOC144637775 isoform X2 [Oculina patagonica]